MYAQANRACMYMKKLGEIGETQLLKCISTFRLTAISSVWAALEGALDVSTEVGTTSSAKQD